MEPGSTSSQPGLAHCGGRIKLSALTGLFLKFDKKVEDENETFKLVTLNSRSDNADIQIYNPEIGTRRSFVKHLLLTHDGRRIVKHVPLTHGEKILTAFGKKVLLLEKPCNRLSIWNFQDGKRFSLPILPHAGGAEVRASVVCEGSENGIRVVLLGTIEYCNEDPWNYNVNVKDHGEVVVIWNLQDVTEGWDIRFNVFRKMKDFNPRSIAIHEQKIWMVLDTGEILVSQDRKSTAPNFVQVPSLPNNFDTQKNSKDHNLYADKPHLVCKVGQGPDYGFAGFIKHGGNLFLVTSYMVYKLQAAKDLVGAEYHMFGQVRRIGGATFIVNEYSQGYGYISSQAENQNRVLIAKSAMMEPGQERKTDCVAFNVITSELSTKVWCKTGDSCTCQHCWIQ